MADADMPRAAPTGPGAGDLEPGQWVRHPGQPDWGPGQVQSVVGHRVTVNFENAGKILINTQVVGLERSE
jgi:hypothetical protein